MRFWDFFPRGVDMVDFLYGVTSPSVDSEGRRGWRMACKKPNTLGWQRVGFHQQTCQITSNYLTKIGKMKNCGFKLLRSDQSLDSTCRNVVKHGSSANQNTDSMNPMNTLNQHKTWEFSHVAVPLLNQALNIGYPGEGLSSSHSHSFPVTQGGPQFFLVRKPIPAARSLIHIAFLTGLSAASKAWVIGYTLVN